jgi:hypothetical protein
MRALTCLGARGRATAGAQPAGRVRRAAYLVRSGSGRRRRRMTCRLGRRCTNRRNAGLELGASRRWRMTCARVLRVAAGRAPQPTAVIVDSRTVQSTLTSGARAGYDGRSGVKGSKVYALVDAFGHLLALRVAAANEQDCDCLDWWTENRVVYGVRGARRCLEPLGSRWGPCRAPARCGRSPPSSG